MKQITFLKIHNFGTMYMKFQKIRNPVHNLEMNYLNSKEVNHFKNNLKSSIGIDQLLQSNSKKIYQNSQRYDQPNTQVLRILYDQKQFGLKPFKPDSKWTLTDLIEKVDEDIPTVLMQLDSWLDTELDNLANNFENELKEIICEKFKLSSSSQVDLQKEIQKISNMDDKKFHAIFIAKQN